MHNIGLSAFKLKHAILTLDQNKDIDFVSRDSSLMPQEITHWLNDWAGGDASAYDRIVTALYDQLHRIAAKYMNQENPGHTMQATALVHEAYARIVEVQVDWQDRDHFLGVMSRIMRRVLVDHARARNRKKRGDGVALLRLDDMATVAGEENASLVELDDAMTQLGQMDPRKEQALELFYFAGLTHPEIAQTLSISLATVDRDLRMGRAWLKKTIGESN